MNSLSDESALPAVRIFGACSFLFWTSISLSLNILLVISLNLGRDSFSRNAFYAITWQIVICDMTSNILEYFIAIPVTFAGVNFYGDNLLAFPCFFETLSYNGTLFFSVLMTINRISVFLFPNLNRFFFQDHLKIVIGALWLAIISVLIAWNVIGCYKTFSAAGFFYHYVHTEPADSLLGYYIGRLFLHSSTVLPVFMFAAYVIMIISIQVMLHFDFTNWKMRQSSLISLEENQSQSLKREFSLLAQAFMICGTLEINNLVFTYIPRISAEGQWIFFITFVGRWISLSVTSINAIVLFSFNREIRRKLRKFIRNSWGTTSIVPISLSSSHHQ